MNIDLDAEQKGRMNEITLLAKMQGAIRSTLNEAVARKEINSNRIPFIMHELMDLITVSYKA